MLISVEDTEDRAKLRLAKGIEKVKDLLQPVVSLSCIQKRQEKNCFVCFPVESSFGKYSHVLVHSGLSVVVKVVKEYTCTI